MLPVRGRAVLRSSEGQQSDPHSADLPLWANLAVAVNDHYQSVVLGDVNAVF